MIEKLVYDSALIKSAIVNRDEREQGERRKLNFGHTFGHAVEKTTGTPHGEAVSMGMAVASRLSEKRGYLRKRDVQRVQDLLKKFKLPTRLPADGSRIMEALGKDKKRNRDGIHFVLLRDLGHAVVEEISMKELEHEIEGLYEAKDEA